MASFALWFCDCAILLSIPLTDDDIKIQRRHIKLGNNELKRQLATNDRWAAGTEATELFSAEFHPNVAQTQNGVGKTHGSGDCGFVHASAVVVLTFATVKWQDEDGNGNSKENLEKNCGIQFYGSQQGKAVQSKNIVRRWTTLLMLKPSRFGKEMQRVWKWNPKGFEMAPWNPSTLDMKSAGLGQEIASKGL